MNRGKQGGPVTEERFEQLLEAYGASLSKLPPVERAGVEALLASSERAQRAWEAAQAFDALLDEQRAELSPSPALRAALRAIPEANPRGGELIQLFSRRTRTMSALAAAAAVLLGVWMGSEQHTGNTAASGAEADAVELAELSELAMGSDLASDLGAFEGDGQ